MIDHMPTDDELLTTPQAAILLGCSHRTVHRMAVDGVLAPAQKLPGPNGAFLFKRSDVTALIAARDTSSVAAS